MTIDRDTQTQILRYHFVEGWPVNTIAAQLQVHHSVVDRVISQAGQPKSERTRRASKIDPFVPFILQTLEQFPRLSAARLYGMVCARGYQGGASHFRARVAQLRPARIAPAYLRLRTLAGEQCQVDWAHFGQVQIGSTSRPLMALVMVLSYSRMLFVRFYLNARMDSFLDGHVRAFELFGGAARSCLYDNLKSAVLERRAQAIRFNPALLELAAHYRFEPRAAAPGRGNEKGRVERAIRYLRQAFFAARIWSDVTDLNAQAQAWCLNEAAQRPWAEGPQRTVGQVWREEQALLVGLPDTPFFAQELTEVRVGKTPYVRFDLNDYTVPHTHVHRTLTVAATHDTVRVLEGVQVLACHRRAWGRNECVEQPEHVQALVADKRQAREHRAQDRLALAAPASITLLETAAAAGRPITSLVRELDELLDHYGGAELQLACTEALAAGVAHTNAVRQVLERRRDARALPPPLAVALPDDARVRNLVVRPASLAAYDQLGAATTDPNEDPNADSAAQAWTSEPPSEETSS